MQTHSLEFNTLQALKRIFYFRTLTEQQLDALANITSIQKFKNAECIFGEGEPAEAFYVIASGKVQIYKISKEGKEVILHLFGPGEIFAEVPIFSGIPVYPANALCLSDVELLAINGQGFRDLATQHPEILMQIMVVFAKRLHEFNQLIGDLSLRNVDARLAKYLLSISENLPSESIDIQVQKKTLAAILGTIPETLSRAFKKLEQDACIQVENNTVHILNRSKLVELADVIELEE